MFVQAAAEASPRRPGRKSATGVHKTQKASAKKKKTTTTTTKKKKKKSGTKWCVLFLCMTGD